MDILTETQKITRWVLPIDATTDMSAQPDNVYPFAGVEDQWAVVMNGTQIAWAAEYSTACMIYISALQTKHKHAQRCPTDSIPYDGISSGLPQYECRHCGKMVELSPADMYGEAPAVCECGRFYTPVVEADDLGLSEATI